MWLNGYGVFDQSFVIWNDENCQVCQTWVDIDTSNPISTLSYADQAVINNFVNSRLENNPTDYFSPWVFAYEAANYLNSRDLTRSYTAVVSQGHLSYYNARFCGIAGQYHCGIK